MKRKSFSGILLGVAVLIVLVMMVWGSDRITLQGERTIYSVKCERGTWDGARCTGSMVAGDRYAFRASPRRQEVLYWVRESSEPSDKYADCVVTDRNNWACNPQPGQRPSIAHALKDGRPVPGKDGSTLPFHDVPKWKYWVLSVMPGAFSVAAQ